MILLLSMRNDSRIIILGQYSYYLTYLTAGGSLNDRFVIIRGGKASRRKPQP